MNVKRFFLLCLTLVLFAGCASRPKQEPLAPEPLPEPPAQEAEGEGAAAAASPPLRLTFAGDLMAHSVNFEMADYSLIYRDIEAIIQNDDVSFVNLETPVCAERPYETYPTFNVQPPYADAAVSAGFDAFSLANNHTNDQGRVGVAATYAYFSRKTGVWAAGIRESAEQTISWQVIEKNGWTILFAAVTEILNSPRNKERIDYFPPSERERLIEVLKALRREHPADVFVLSLHTAEEEYVRTIARSRREFYARLLDAGVDILWANHIHAAREWEMSGAEGRIDKLVFYSAGNTISGQRTRYNFENPGSDRDYTGDGFLYQVEISRIAPESPGWEISQVTPVLITAYRDSANQYTIKRLTPEFIADLRQRGKTQESLYFEKRKGLMEKTQGKVIWR